MATPIERLTSVAAGIVGRDLDNAALARFALGVCEHWKPEFNEFANNPNNPTNNERALFTLLKMRQWAQTILRVNAESKASLDARAAIAAAGEAAAADLNE